MADEPLPSGMDRAAFVARFAHLFEESPWVAEETFDRGLSAGCDTAAGLHAALCDTLRAASPQRQLTLLQAHPDLAGRLAQAGELTPDSTAEQASVGLDLLSSAERERFAALNSAYRERFGFPFIIAVKGRSKAEIVAAFERRLRTDEARERAAALAEVERIAWLRLMATMR
jgi:OHCU decarboxylase